MSYQTGLLRLTEHSRSVEQEFLESLTDDERNAVGSADRWAAKDLIAHLTAWRHRGIEDLLSARRGQVLEEIEEFDPVNLEIFEAHRHLSLEEVTSRSVAAWQAFSDALEATPDELLLSSEPSGGRRPLWRRVTIEAINHPVTHLAESAIQHDRAHLARGLGRGHGPPAVGPGSLPRVARGCALQPGMPPGPDRATRRRPGVARGRPDPPPGPAGVVDAGPRPRTAARTSSLRLGYRPIALKPPGDLP